MARALGAKAGDSARAADAGAPAAVAEVSATVALRPRVAFVEWVDPLMAGGNWMPELIEIAGGQNLFGQAGKHSDWMQWQELVAADPEAIVVAPCGYGLERCLEELPLLQAKPGWASLDCRAQRPRLLRRRQRLFQPPRPAPRRLAPRCWSEMLHPEAAPARYEGTAWVRHAPQAASAP